MKEIILTQGKVSTVDDEFFENFSGYSWYFEHGYARRDKMINGSRKRFYMHREVLEVSEVIDKGLCVDHIDGNKLNNQKSNLRVCSYSQNVANSRKWSSPTTSKFKGVYRHKHSQRWVSNLMINRKFIHLGYFETEEEAAEAYNEKAKETFGEFARLNQISI